MKKNKLRGIICAATAAAMLLACFPAAALAENADFSLMAATPDTTYTIYAGSSMEFTNLSSSEQTAYLNGERYTIEYAVYYKDGSVKEYDAADYGNSKTLTIPAEGTLYVGSNDAYSGVQCKIADDYFLTEEIAEPLYEHVCLASGESWHFTNDADTEYNLILASNSGMSVVFYDASRAFLSKTNKSDDFAVPSGYTVEVTGYNACSEICAIRGVFTSEKLDTQVTGGCGSGRMTGENYYYANNGEYSQSILYDGSYYIYESYDSNGSVTDFGISSKEFTLAPGCSAKLCILSPNLCALPYASGVECHKLDEPFAEMIYLFPGDCRIITNICDTAQKLYSDSSIYMSMNYELYDSSGNLTSSSLYQQINNFSIPSGYTLYMTAIPTGGDDPWMLLFNDIFSTQVPEEDFYDAITFADGDSYIFRNVSGENASLGYIFTDNSDMNYAIYDWNGTYISSTLSEVPAGGYAKISFDRYSFYKASVHSTTLFYKKGYFTCEKADTPVAIHSGTNSDTDGYYTLKYRQTYKITNAGSSDYSAVLSNYSDYILYSASGTLISYAINSKSTIIIPIGGYMYVNSKCNYSILESDGISIEPVNTSIYTTTKIPKDKTYIFENTSTYDMDITVECSSKVFASSNVVGVWYNSINYFDYIIYNINDDIYDSAASAYNSESGYSLTVPAGYTIAVTASGCSMEGMTINVICAADFFSIGECSEQTHFRKLLSDDKSVLIKNLSNITVSVNVEDVISSGYLHYDYKILNEDGSVNSSNLNVRSASEINLPKGGSIILTAKAPLLVSGINELLSVSDSDTPAYDYHQIEYGETMLIRNNDIYSQTLKMYSYEYNYTVYNDDETLKGVYLAQSGDMTLSAGESVAITSCKDVELWAVTLSGTCDVSVRDYPPILTQIVYPGETVTLTNKSRLSASVKVSSPNYSYVAYTIYNSSGEASTVKENEHISSSSSFSVPAGGKIEVSGQRGSVVLYGAYEAFSSEDTDIHVEGITLSSETMTLKVGAQAVLTATVTPSNATNKTVVWSSSDTSVVTAAQTGKIKAVAEGAAIVTAVTEDGDFEARCVVYVTSDGSDPDDPTVPEIPIETEYPYEINSLSIVSESGAALETIALGTSFIIEAEITKTETRSSRDYIFAAVYDKDGALLCIDYVKASFAEDYDYAIGFHVPAQTKAIGSVKVFVWEGFNSEKPLSKSAEISFT